MKQQPTATQMISILIIAKKPIHMTALARKLNTTDRVVRMLVQEIRENELIDDKCLVSDERGYFLTTDKKAIDRWMLNYSRRAISMFRVLRATKKHLSKAEQEKYQLMFNFKL